MSQPKTILVVDDECVIRDLFKRILIRDGYRVCTASEGLRALKVAGTVHPDLVLLDMRMPGIDGVETMRRLKCMKPPMAIVMITGYGTKELAQQAMKLGAHDYITKPFDIQTVREIISKCFELSNLSREVRQLRRRVAREEASLAAENPDNFSRNRHGGR